MTVLSRIIQKLKQGEGGQDYVEFAVIVPILMLIIMGLVDFGRVFNAWLVITHGAREGARVAAVGYDDDAVRDRVDQVTANFAPYITIDPPMVDGTRTTAGNPVTVTVSTSVTLLSRWIAVIVGHDDVSVAAQGVTRYEGPCVVNCP